MSTDVLACPPSPLLDRGNVTNRYCCMKRKGWVFYLSHITGPVTVQAQPVSYSTSSLPPSLPAGHCSFVSSLLSLDSRSLLSLGWDGHLLFWQGIDPIKHSNGGVFPVVEDSQPQCGFKLGTSSSTEFLPVSVCGAAGFGALVLLMSRTRDVHLTYYTFSPISVL